MSDEKEFRVAINDDGSSKKRRLRVLRSKSHIWDCDSASSNGVIEFNNRVGEMRRTETYNQGELQLDQVSNGEKSSDSAHESPFKSVNRSVISELKSAFSKTRWSQVGLASNGLSCKEMIFNRNLKQVRFFNSDGSRERFSFFKDNLTGIRLCCKQRQMTNKD